MKACAGLLGFSVLLATVPAWSAETASYKYDALGRLVRVDNAGGPQSGANTSLQYDAAGNRALVTVLGASQTVLTGKKPIVGFYPGIGYYMVLIN
jgi:YD repeat-containing protein